MAGAAPPQPITTEDLLISRLNIYVPYVPAEHESTSDTESRMSEEPFPTTEEEEEDPDSAPQYCPSYVDDTTLSPNSSKPSLHLSATPSEAEPQEALGPDPQLEERRCS